MSKWLVLFFISTSLHAHWTPRTQQAIQNLDRHYAGPEDGYLMTAWGGWQRMLDFNFNHGTISDIPTSHVRSQKVSTYISKSEGKGARPLFLVFPGIFGHPGQRVTDNFIHQLERFDGHVVVIPNFLSVGWIQAHPLYEESDPAQTELSIVNDVWASVLKQIPAQEISEVHVVAESLGTLISSAWVSQYTGTPAVTSLTLLWPPLELDHALDNLDIYVKDLEKDWGRCGALHTLPIFVRYFVWQKTPQGIPEEDARCLSAWAAYGGFQKMLRQVHKAYVETAKVKDTQPGTFKLFFESYRKSFWELILNKDERVHLSYWLRTAKQKHPELQLRIMSSKDDFLNRGLSWENWMQKNQVRPDEVALLSWGGHSGPVAAKEFFPLLKDTFDKK